VAAVNFYTDGENYDADRDAVLVGDMTDPSWPDTLRLDRPFPTVAASDPGRHEPATSPVGSDHESASSEPSSSPLAPVVTASSTSSARRSPGAA
jgi:hypothetical protein